MKQARLRHVGIVIKDWGKIRPFYEELGFRLFYEVKETWKTTQLIVRKMRNRNGDILEFIFGPWLPHIAFTVHKFPDQGGEAICKFDEKIQVKFIQDPEGNWIEFVKEL